MEVYIVEVFISGVLTSLFLLLMLILLLLFSL